ncbi:cytochrome oxidase complex assembly protein [Rhynchospora pubera]|uniref:Cytochrome oxidase complex assembly protein n=1 Tax=Rhynchospora pubera TaxID=906938 RepID=A0AAV8EJ13_9POAL|nr:cytochrome oxidase complex assembly protein [Rhynchospora pubera]KAJ4778173.1 cytochrome oxidase complex assembly protein [Rhynchospora pubera]KAJ4802611.1 cytochrome oxidase complex assembly protein [Rhynchospora pubera]
MWRRNLSSLKLLIQRSNTKIASPIRALSTSSEKTSNSNDSNGGAKKVPLRRFVQVGLISLAGGLVLSEVNDLAIFHGCTSKAIEKASENSTIVEAIGLPIVRGPWYDASLAVGHKRRSVSCTFPVSGPHGSAIFQLKAIRAGEDGMFSFLRHRDWDILLMEALIHVPGNDEKNQTFRISLTNSLHSSSPSSSTD